MDRSSIKSPRFMGKILATVGTFGIALALGSSPALAAPMGVWVHQRDFQTIFSCTEAGKYDVAHQTAANYDCRNVPPTGGEQVGHYALWEFIN